MTDLTADPDEAKPPSAAALRAAEREKKRSEAREPGVGSAIRPEIQALRAIAVATVVIFHFFPSLVPGGYIGVDVFFAISGFLITGHLIREVGRTQKVSLPGFWARRARRILPAALLVLAFTLVATLLVVPQNLWDQFLAEIRASTLYYENWYLAGQAVDYLGQDNRPSPVQHYWSLSVEEQFYIFWPVLIVIAMLFARRAADNVRIRAIATMLALLTAVSLAWSIIGTATTPESAFFITPTRVWEFGAGGLLALMAASRADPRLRAAVSWAGVLMILAAAFLYTRQTPFPGYAAMLPIAGTLLVIWAGAPPVRWAPLGWMRLQPVQWTGDVSYSIYLWHWPLLILTPFLLDRQLTVPVKFLLIGLTLVLAALSKRFVEDPVRKGSFLARERPRKTALVMVVATLPVLLGVAFALSALKDRQASDQLAAERLLASNPACLGAASRDPKNQPCVNPKLKNVVIPSPGSVKFDEGGKGENRNKNVCIDGLKEEDGLSVCGLGVRPSKARRQAALIGDSHAAQWRPAFSVLGKERDWYIASMTEGGCDFTTVTRDRSPQDPEACAQWKRDIPRWLEAHPEVSTVFFSQMATGDPSEVGSYKKAWAGLPASVKQVVVVRDNPRTTDTSLDCIERAIAQGRLAGPACANPRSDADRIDSAAVAASELGGRKYRTVDLTDFYCDRRRCYPVIGGVLVYADGNHQSPQWNQTLAPFLLRALERDGWLLPPPDRGNG